MPFTIEEFLNVFRQYNTGVWPAQIFLYAFALLTLIFIIWEKRYSNIVATIVLAFLWLWMGIVYNLIYFSPINKAAFLFGGIFIIQGMLFLYYGLYKPDQLRFSFYLNYKVITGIIFIMYALLIYPILAKQLGHLYPAAPTFGLPCPTTIFTFGILLLAINKVPRVFLIIPFLWSLMGFVAAIKLGIKEDFGLAIAGLIGTTILIFDPSGLKSVVSHARQ